MIRYLIALPDTYILNNRIYPFVNSLLIKTIEGLSELTQPPSSTIICHQRKIRHFVGTFTVYNVNTGRQTHEKEMKN